MDVCVPPRNGFVFISLLKIFSVRLDVKIPVDVSLMEWVGWAPAATAPNPVDPLGAININAYTASIKVVFQERTNERQCTGLSQNEQIYRAKKSFPWH